MTILSFENKNQLKLNTNLLDLDPLDMTELIVELAEKSTISEPVV